MFYGLRAQPWCGVHTECKHATSSLHCLVTLPVQFIPTTWLCPQQCKLKTQREREAALLCAIVLSTESEQKRKSRRWVENEDSMYVCLFCRRVMFCFISQQSLQTDYCSKIKTDTDPSTACDTGLQNCSTWKPDNQNFWHARRPSDWEPDHRSLWWLIRHHDPPQSTKHKGENWHSLQSTSQGYYYLLLKKWSHYCNI